MEKILILDFGSQYTQLIARRVRELNVYSEIVPYNKIPVGAASDPDLRGVILSGSPFSVTDANALIPDLSGLLGVKPLLAVCYGAQYLAKLGGGNVGRSAKREYGRAHLTTLTPDPLLEGIPNGSQVWMSHGDTILALPSEYEVLAKTESIDVAAFRSRANAHSDSSQHPAPVYGIQFHPEVAHSIDGGLLLRNFVHGICACSGDWTSEAFIDTTVAALRTQTNGEHVLLALSGGVDSTVAAGLLHRAVGERLFCFFIDNGLLREGEYEQVLESYLGMGLRIKGVDAKQRFYDALAGLTDPEAKRKAIGRAFIEVFEEEAKQYDAIKWLGQGTIYPDVIESVSVHGPSVTIKSHHNVGGLPDRLQLKIIEPLRMLFKDEVRRVGATLGIPKNILSRHPFPGPGLAIRILGDITPAKVALLQAADAVFIRLLREHGLYDEVWQAGAILLPVQSVGVMGDERTYELAVALRAVTSSDGMTAEWARLPYDFLATVSNEIVNQVRGINRVVYDISSKPPATIEWE